MDQDEKSRMEGEQEDVPGVVTSSNESSNECSSSISNGRNSSSRITEKNAQHDDGHNNDSGKRTAEVQIAAYDEYSDEFLWSSTPPFDEQKEDPLLQHLTSLDESMRCPICRLVFTIPVMIPSCKHCFCSECIRKSLKAGLRGMKRKSECPVCRQLTDERELVSNYSLGEISKTWSDTRSHLYTTLATFYTNNPSNPKNVPNNMSNNSSISKQDGSCTETDDDDDDKKDEEFSISNKATKKRKRSAISMEKTSITTATTTTTAHRLRPKPTPHYHGMKRKEIQNLLKKDGLSILGTDAEMKERHKEYLLLYNAECDAQYPRSNQEIVKTLQQRELKRKEEIRHSFKNGTRNHTNYMQNLKKACENDGIKRTSGNATFDQTLNKNFKDLIQKAKERGIVKSPKRPFDVSKYDEPDDNNNGNPSPPKTEKNNGENPQTNNNHNNNINAPHRSPNKTPKRIKNPYLKSPFARNKPSFGSATEPNVPVKSIPEIPSIQSPKQHNATSSTISPLKSIDLTSIPNTYRPASSNKSLSMNTTLSNVNVNPIKKSHRFEWQCVACTFINKNRCYANATCEMCGTRRPT